MIYRSVVFIAGDETDQPFKILNEEGEGALFEYLLQWDGDFSPTTNFEPWGSSDDTAWIEQGGLLYVVSWNWNLSYIALTEVIR